MWYRTLPAPEKLQGLVRGVSGSSVLSGPFAPRRVLPDGGVDLLVSLDLTAGEAWIEVFGAKSAALVVQNERPLEKLAVHLRPGAFSRFFEVPARELRDRGVALDDLAPSLARGLAPRLAELPDWDARRRAFERVLMERAGRCADTTALARLTSHAVACIARSRGALSLRALARELDVAPRTLERGFDLHVGLGPKRFARVLRVQHAAQALAAGARAVDVAAGLGFADQPHMVREFRALAGVAPAQLAREEQGQRG